MSLKIKTNKRKPVSRKLIVEQVMHDLTYNVGFVEDGLLPVTRKFSQEFFQGFIRCDDFSNYSRFQTVLVFENDFTIDIYKDNSENKFEIYSVDRGIQKNYKALNEARVLELIEYILVEVRKEREKEIKELKAQAMMQMLANSPEELQKMLQGSFEPVTFKGEPTNSFSGFRKEPFMPSFQTHSHSQQEPEPEPKEEEKPEEKDEFFEFDFSKTKTFKFLQEK